MPVAAQAGKLEVLQVGIDDVPGRVGRSGFESALGMSAIAPIATELLHYGNRRAGPSSGHPAMATIQPLLRP